MSNSKQIKKEVENNVKQARATFTKKVFVVAQFIKMKIDISKYTKQH